MYFCKAPQMAVSVRYIHVVVSVYHEGNLICNQQEKY